MEDLIKRDDAISKTFCTSIDGMPRMVVLLDDIKAIPSADRPSGEWIWGNEKKSWHKCSVCGEQAYSYYDELADDVEELFDYCPNCGARMKGERDDH